MSEECKVCRFKKRDEDEKRLLINRLSRIEGQIRGVRAMVENDAYCTDIFVQASAAISALSSFNRELLCSHIKTCVLDDIKSGKEESVNELFELLGKFIK